MLVAVGSFKGSPGATSATLALAAGWPMQAAGVEADPSGGDFAVRLRTGDGDALPERPSVLSLAAEARSNMGVPELVARFAIETAPGVRVVQGFTDPARAHGLVGLWPDLARALSTSSMDVIVDVGRLTSTTAAGPILQSADAIVVVCRAELGSIVHLRERIGPMAGLGRGRQGIYPLVVTPHRQAKPDVAEVTEVLQATSGVVPGVTYRQVLSLAYDPGGMRRLYAGDEPGGKLGRAPLLRSARALASALYDDVTSAQRQEVG